MHREATTSPSVTGSDAAAAVLDTANDTVDPDIDAELLVEEISIDGMCGVY
jgi:mycofactocin precursor